MENIYDIKYKKKLNFILPAKYSINKNNAIKDKKIVIIIHLHYPETVDFYLRYIENIPKDIDILITYSNPKVEEILTKSETIKRINCKIIKKQNRGRDISAFLVSCRQYIGSYEYVCFLHDKKEKDISEKKDIEKWIWCLWENMIGSAEYINNVITTFCENQILGLLVPPFFMSEHLSTLYDNDIWYNDFILTKKLAEKMKLQCDMDELKLPITLGTTFWARVPALKKLFDMEWKYEDFDEEPLKIDGTISHAVERIFAYVGQDAGFETGWVMSDRYFAEEFEYMQSILKTAFHRLSISLGIWKISELNSYESKLEKLSNFIDRFEKYYIYGAGDWGRRCLTMLINESKGPEAFLVSNISENPKSILSIPVYSLNQVSLNDNCGIIIAMNKMYCQEVLEIIKSNYPQFSNIYLFLEDKNV